MSYTLNSNPLYIFFYLLTCYAACRVDVDSISGELSAPLCDLPPPAEEDETLETSVSLGCIFFFLTL